MEVDETTGERKVLKIISANDVGKVLNYDAVKFPRSRGRDDGAWLRAFRAFHPRERHGLTNTLGKCRIPDAAMTPDICSGGSTPSGWTGRCKGFRRSAISGHCPIFLERDLQCRRCEG